MNKSIKSLCCNLAESNYQTILKHTEPLDFTNESNIKSVEEIRSITDTNNVSGFNKVKYIEFKHINKNILDTAFNLDELNEKVLIKLNKYSKKYTVPNTKCFKPHMHYETCLAISKLTYKP